MTLDPGCSSAENKSSRAPLSSLGSLAKLELNDGNSLYAKLVVIFTFL